MVFFLSDLPALFDLIGHCLYTDEATAGLLEAASEDIRGVLAARLGPVPLLVFVKDLHYDPGAAMEKLMQRTGLPAEDSATRQGCKQILFTCTVPSVGGAGAAGAE